jgi:rhodanese-related sulfurtransferase
MDLLALGYFQFNNLVENRVPFLLVNLGVDLTGLFNSVSMMSLENNTLNTTLEKASAEIAAKKLPPHFAIVSICRDGKESCQLAKMLEDQGVVNSYYVEGGCEEFAKQKATQG